VTEVCTFAWFDGARLSLDGAVRGPDVAPGALSGVWVSAVVVLADTYANKGEATAGFIRLRNCFSCSSDKRKPTLINHSSTVLIQSHY